MPKSMTGFGRSLVTTDTCTLNVEIKSVNSKFCEINTKIPHVFMALDPMVRQIIRERVGRGKIDVFVTYEDRGEPAKLLTVDFAYATAYCEAIKALGEHIGSSYSPTAKDLSFVSGVLNTKEAPADIDKWIPLMQEALRQACDDLDAAREKEGSNLMADISLRIENIRNYIGEVEAIIPQIVPRFREKLMDRIRLALDATNSMPDEQRFMTEVALFADKCDITEEITRLKSHIELFKNTINSEEGFIGKRLDFIIQEINREINTTGSKANYAPLTEVVVKMKCELEKIREQVQNIA